MKITYIFHSGFAIETDDLLLVFDYWMDPAHVIDGLLKSDKPMYVFVSHFHEDHFQHDIYTWKGVKKNIMYLLSKDIFRHRRAKREDADVWFGKGTVWQDEMLKVVATGSNDSGVSWIVETAGKCFFHAGDLNNWYARFLSVKSPKSLVHTDEFDEDINPIAEEKRFLGELKDIRKITDRFDVVMFPIDGRIGNGYTLGGRQFIERFEVGLFVPMHFVVSGFESSWRMAEFTEEKRIHFWKIHHEGETLCF